MTRHYASKQEIAPTVEPTGVDYLCEGKVLVRYRDRRLVWRPGRNGYWAGKQHYCCAYLQVLYPEPGWGIMSKAIFNGRYSKRMVRENIKRIRDRLHLEELEAREINRHRTLIVED